MFRPTVLATVASLLLSIAAVAQLPATAAAARASLYDAQLERLVAAALTNAPEMVVAQSALEAARRRIVPAKTLADPFLSTTWQNDGRSISLGKAEGSFIGLMASQAIPWPGKLRLAGAIAESESREVEEGPVRRTQLALEARVRNAWYDLMLARAIDRIIVDRRNTASQLEASVRERYSVGLTVQQDVLRAQVELVRIEEQQATQVATTASRLAELNRVIGAPQDQPVDLPARLPEDGTVAPLEDLLSAVRARSPELASATQTIETGRIRVDLAKKNFLPDFSVNAGSMYRGSFEMGPMWQVGVGVSIPLWIERRQKNQLAEAQAMVRGRTAENATVSQELELRTRERVSQLQAALRIAALYRDKVLPLDDLSLESALASYQAGKVPFITVLDALNTVYTDRTTYAGRLAESAKWRVAIDEATLQPTAMSGGPSTGSSSMGGGNSQPAAQTGANSSSSSTNSMR